MVKRQVICESCSFVAAFAKIAYLLVKWGKGSGKRKRLTV